MRDVRPVPKAPIALSLVTWEDGFHHLMGRGSGRKETFEELLRRARSGDHGALEELFRRARPRLEREASKRVTKRQPGGESRSDIEQESAQRALAKLDTFQGSTEAEFFQWLDKIVYSRVMQSARDAQRAKRKIPGGLPLDAPEAAAAPSPRTSPSRAAARKEEWHVLLSCLHELPEAQQEAIRLHYFEELTYKEAGERMGRPADEVKRLAAQGIHAMQARVEERDEALMIERLRALKPSS